MSKRILIIDDEEHIRRMMRLTLEAAGYAVGEAPDGPEGLKLYRDGSDWAGVVLDQRMPGMDGLETLRRLKASNPRVRVVMATAYASIELAVDAMKLGASDFVRKPMTPETLRNAVAAALTKETEALTASEQALSLTPEPTWRPVIENLTMNGFSFVRASDVEAASRDKPNERSFRVKTLNGLERLVIVDIDSEAVAYVGRMTNRNLPPENSFWTHRAEHVLSLYLWNQGGLPPNGRLIVSDISREELDIAARWERD
jgi:CheY-like chemotaxis protein